MSQMLIVISDHFMTYSLEFGWFLLRSIRKYEPNGWIICNYLRVCHHRMLGKMSANVWALVKNKGMSSRCSGTKSKHGISKKSPSAGPQAPATRITTSIRYPWQICLRWIFMWLGILNMQGSVFKVILGIVPWQITKSSPPFGRICLEPFQASFFHERNPIKPPKIRWLGRTQCIHSYQ